MSTSIAVVPVHRRVLPLVFPPLPAVVWILTVVIGACNPLGQTPPIVAIHGDTAGCPGQIRSISDPDIFDLALADCRRRDFVLRQISSESQRLGLMMWSIPEYHDEQRFLADPTTFGPIVNIFASPYLGGFQYPWQLEEQGPRGMVVAVVYVDASPGTALPVVYRRLQLAPGMNCIWLAQDPGAPSGTWIAFASHVVSVTEPCRDTDPRRPLAVVVRRGHPFTHPADYPPVARFTEGQSGQPLLGVRCFDAWCDIGPRQPDGRPAFTPRATIAGQTSRPALIPGWHDEQILAYKDAAGILRPSGLRATLIPEMDLDQKSEASFQGTWVLVAKIHIEGDPAGGKYATWGLRTGWNHFWLRKDAAKWRAQVTDANGNFAKEWRHVDRHLHHDAAVPGTARFRWTSYDDGIWVPCGQACCRSDDAQ